MHKVARDTSKTTQMKITKKERLIETRNGSSVGRLLLVVLLEIRRLAPILNSIIERGMKLTWSHGKAEPWPLKVFGTHEY